MSNCTLVTAETAATPGLTLAFGIILGIAVSVFVAKTAQRPSGSTPPRRPSSGANRFDEYEGEEYWRWPADAAQQAGFSGEPRRVRGSRR